MSGRCDASLRDANEPRDNIDTTTEQLKAATIIQAETAKNSFPGPLDKEKVKEQLIGYIIVPQDAWDTVPSGSHIRYIGVDGKYRQGAFVKDTFTREGKNYFQLETKRYGKIQTQGYTTWPLPYEKIRHLYKKIPVGSATEFNMVRKELSTMIDQFEDIRNEIFEESNKRYQLECRLDKFETDLSAIKALLNRVINHKENDK